MNCKKIILVLILIITAVSLIACGNDTPGKVVSSYINSANDKDYKASKDCLSKNSEVMMDNFGNVAGGFEKIMDEQTNNCTVSKVDIVSEEINGDKATVKAKLTYKNGTSKETGVVGLVKEDGDWKIGQ